MARKKSEFNSALTECMFKYTNGMRVLFEDGGVHDYRVTITKDLLAVDPEGLKPDEAAHVMLVLTEFMQRVAARACRR